MQPSSEVISIDVGRQLLVDGVLIEKSTLERAFHRPRKSDRNPILRPTSMIVLDIGECPVAAPFNNGVWWDEREGVFKMWYHA